MALKIVYFGTPEFAAKVLESLVPQDVEVLAVVTQPDRPKGRSKEPAFSPVKQIALTRFSNIPILQPLKSSDPDFLEILSGLKADLFVVVAFGQILPQKLLDIPPMGCINIHASLLPLYRGAAPMQRCLMNGELETGVCIQKMVRQLDAGPVIAEETHQISPNENLQELHDALCDLSKPLLAKVLQLFQKQQVRFVEQDHAKATYAHKVEPEDGELDLKKSALELHNQIRGLSPKPGAWIMLKNDQKRLKIYGSKIVKGFTAEPGIICPKTHAIACKEDGLYLTQVQPEGKKVMAWEDFLRGHPGLKSL